MENTTINFIYIDTDKPVLGLHENLVGDKAGKALNIHRKNIDENSFYVEVTYQYLVKNYEPYKHLVFTTKAHFQVNTTDADLTENQSNSKELEMFAIMYITVSSYCRAKVEEESKKSLKLIPRIPYITFEEAKKFVGDLDVHR